MWCLKRTRLRHAVVAQSASHSTLVFTFMLPYFAIGFARVGLIRCGS